MISRNLLVVISLGLIGGVSLLVLAPTLRKDHTPPYKPGLSSEADQAVRQSQKLYHDLKKAGMDFTNGPCLSNDILPGWVTDIVHVPRNPVDDLPQNQCQAFIEGRAQHFVELDIDGNIVRVK